MRSPTAKLAAAATLAALMLCATACEEEVPGPNQPTTPSVSVSTTDPEPTEPEVETFPATVIIEDRPVEFPPAVLVLRTNGRNTTAVLYTDDPKEMLGSNYRGNSFYFEMDLGELSVEDILTGGEPDTPPGQRLVTPFVYFVEESRRTGTPNGLFLNGGQFVLQPKDASFVLNPNGSELAVEITGMFARFAGDEAFSGERVIVRATLTPEVVQE